MSVLAISNRATHVGRKLALQRGRDPPTTYTAPAQMPSSSSLSFVTIYLLKPQLNNNIISSEQASKTVPKTRMQTVCLFTYVKKYSIPKYSHTVAKVNDRVNV